MDKTENTRKRIIDAALKLFNRDGAHRVTTNHIARECEMSPGNLYYHYRNKQEIIREIFHRITVDFTELWSNGAGDPYIEEILSRMDALSDLYYRYRFFYLELPTLIAQDTELAKMYAANQKAKLAAFDSIYANLCAKGVIDPAAIDAEMFRTQIINGWIVSDFWLSYLAVCGRKITPDSVRELGAQFAALIAPYVKPR
ncbi:MAG TPA: TetR/AcrR family transcriptional regulator [Spirochaetota bacterium]|nr:TetR/AcrR family transcriptional regulator [Spirochaetota bacterium]